MNPSADGSSRARPPADASEGAKAKSKVVRAPSRPKGGQLGGVAGAAIRETAPYNRRPQGNPGTKKTCSHVSASSSFDIVGMHRGDSVAAIGLKKLLEARTFIPSRPGGMGLC